MADKHHRPDLIMNPAESTDGTDMASVHCLDSEKYASGDVIDDDGYASAGSSTSPTQSAQPGCKAKHPSAQGKGETSDCDEPKEHKPASEDDEDLQSRRVDLFAATYPQETSQTQVWSSSACPKRCRTHLRDASQSVSNSSSLARTKPDYNAGGPLRTLLLPDMLRAKGVRLVSPSDLNLHGRPRSLSSPLFGGHRRTVSMPAHLWYQQYHTQQGLPYNPAREVYQRETDLDTFEEVYIGDWVLGDPDVESTNAIEASLLADASDATNPLRAGLGRSFRSLGNGTSTKPARLVFKSDAFVLDFEGQAANFNGRERAQNKGGENGDIVIEAWIVDDESFDETDLHPFRTDSIDIPENLADWMESLPALNYEYPLLHQEVAEPTLATAPNALEEDIFPGSLSLEAARTRIIQSADAPMPNTVQVTVPLGYNAPLAAQPGHKSSSSLSAMPRIGIISSQPLASEEQYMDSVGDLAVDWALLDSDHLSPEGFTQSSHRAERNESPFTPHIREIWPYRAEAFYSLSNANEAEVNEGEPETLCEYKGRVYRAIKGVPKTITSYKGKKEDSRFLESIKRKSVSSLHRCRPRGALDRRIGCWRRLKEVK